MRFERAQKRVQSFEALAQVVRALAEAETQIAVHTEMIARDDEHALLFAQPRRELRRIDAVVVTDVDDSEIGTASWRE
jgi:hypothetical protein